MSPRPPQTKTRQTNKQKQTRKTRFKGHHLVKYNLSTVNTKYLEQRIYMSMGK